ncbi:hypothetical protein OKW49_002836 [Paraburkholderia youngii]
MAGVRQSLYISFRSSKSEFEVRLNAPKLWFGLFDYYLMHTCIPCFAPTS